jgi:hypothetical protein
MASRIIVAFLVHCLAWSTAVEGQYFHTAIPSDSMTVPAGARLARLNVVALEQNAGCKFKDAPKDLVLTTAHHKAGKVPLNVAASMAVIAFNCASLLCTAICHHFVAT